MYSETDPQAANYNQAPGAYDYYTDPARGNVPQYRNTFDVTSWDTWLTLDALRQAPEITAPTIVVHSDGSALPDHAKRLYDSVRGEKELVWADGTHARADGQRRGERDAVLPHPPGLGAQA
ncbi:alpha/beta hydrolase [Streptomyces sp. V2]|uniref:alpha/beta hydrolase n=1 Tax=Streptomyces TaxID=1883 RepID=UPI0006EBC1E2|nr:MULTISPECIES: alpha/beta hydrolase [Streptomyces]PWG14252.1 alpha/beta hydrolase [Streptomyces sp. V2]